MSMHIPNVEQTKEACEKVEDNAHNIEKDFLYSDTGIERVVEECCCTIL